MSALGHYMLADRLNELGITGPLSQQVNLLSDLLEKGLEGQVGPDVTRMIRELQDLCVGDFDSGSSEGRSQAASILDKASLDELEWVLRQGTAFFRLVNESELREISRINRSREQRDAGGTPRKESISDAVLALKESGFPQEDLAEMLERIDVRPTFTAHPTEARRRSVLFKQQRIGELLELLQSTDQTLREEQDYREELYEQILLLLSTDEIRAQKRKVQDEVQHGIYFYTTTIWETIPSIYADLEHALDAHFGDSPAIPEILRYHSWIGGDQDGNPFVTPPVMQWTLTEQRKAVLRIYAESLRMLRRALSVSDRRVEFDDDFNQSILADLESVPLGENLLRLHEHEPLRLKISVMMQRINSLLEAAEEGEWTDPDYGSAAFVSDLKLIESALVKGGLGQVARGRQFQNLLRQAEVFGFYLVSLDLRQHSQVHETTVADLLRLGGVVDDYLELSEEERLKVLKAELHNPRPLRPPGSEMDGVSAVSMETLALLQRANRDEPEAFGPYIVSMTHDLSDMFEVLLLAKEAGVWSVRDGVVRSGIDVVPLFETIEDLKHAAEFMDQLFNDDLYRLQLDARSNFQELMLGYSDSNKDGGFFMANWALQTAQATLGPVCREHKVNFRLFHGRGGSVGRGGGRANRAIVSLPPISQNGQIRFTEQGEVISFRYSMKAIAHRHMEQIVSAMIQCSARESYRPNPEFEPTAEDSRLVSTMSEASMKAYRDRIDDPDFWTWYTEVTPIEHISKLPIASRPVSRKDSNEVDFDGLRAIPWVFAWTQTRYNLPGWYGIGEALKAAIDSDPGAMVRLKEMYGSWSFFRSLLNNAQREMARARFEISKSYSGFSERDYHQELLTAFEEAKALVLEVTGQENFLDNDPVLQRSIKLRNPYTDVLNLCQVELMKRWRSSSEEGDRQRLRQLLFLSINGIAAAMQSTG